jgi:hypothetical protein
MRISLPAAAVTLSFIAAGCSSGGSPAPLEPPALDQDYSSNFSGTWEVTGTVRMGASSQQSSGLQQVTSGGRNVLLFLGACSDSAGSASLSLRAIVTSASSFEFDRLDCTQSAPCGSVTVSFERGTGQVAQGTLAATVNGTASGCGQRLSYQLSFSGIRQQGFTETGTLATARDGHSATLLDSGQVLVIGGYAAAAPPSTATVATAELYDPNAGTFTTTGDLLTPRTSHTATLLPGGQVLIAGGEDASLAILDGAELYDVRTGAFTTTGSLQAARYSHTATLLPDGRVLLAGGSGGASNGPTATAELYDPRTGVFSATGSMNTARRSHTATLLKSGKVLIAGGSAIGQPGTAEIYDPSTGSFSLTGELTMDRYAHTATLLPDGRVLVAGGYNLSDPVASAEIYDPGTGVFTTTESLAAPRASHTALLMPSGQVLLAGGVGGSTPFLDSAELFDPGAGTFRRTGSLAAARAWHTATLLPNGKGLVVGGMNQSPPGFLASAELFETLP